MRGTGFARTSGLQRYYRGLDDRRLKNDNVICADGDRVGIHTI